MEPKPKLSKIRAIFIIILCAVLGYILAELWNVFRIVSVL